MRLTFADRMDCRVKVRASTNGLQRVSDGDVDVGGKRASNGVAVRP